MEVGEPGVSQKADPDAATQFGANQWMVDELYEQYLADKHAVDPAWWEFFEDYRPGEGSAANGSPQPRPEPAAADGDERPAAA
ncbi:hypothetical protein, partial [Actinotalea sp. C106]|uniref:2-oxoglutarate dehydrogenase E1 subunit family protein n=1 Tax=Actinotalea sp. C106 TaxID=2908644 RepID=UPI0035AB7FCC